MTERELKTKAEEAILNCLKQAPFLQILNTQREASREASKDFSTVDLLLKVGLPQGERRLVFEIRPSGQPRYAREAANLLLRYKQEYPGAYGVFVAPYISPQTSELCLKEGLGTIDLAGNCRLCFDQVFIKNQGNPNPFIKRRDLASLYAPKATRILRILLEDSRRAWKVHDLAKTAEISLGQVSNVRKLLLEREWISEERGRMQLLQPQALLKEWSENYSFRDNQVWHLYSLATSREMETRLREVCEGRKLRYALTGFSASNRMAPMVHNQRVMAFVDSIDQQLLAQLEAKEVESGPNLLLMVPYDSGVYYAKRELEGGITVSPLQAYLDLKNYKGRGEEAAEAILERMIEPSW